MTHQVPVLDVYWQPMLGNARQPVKAHRGDAGWDLLTSRVTLIERHTSVDVHTDLAVAIPDGWYGHILGRSSTHRRGLFVQPAVIDAGYRGELFVMVANHTPHNVELGLHERVAQLIILPVPHVQWHEVPYGELTESERGDRGFGSTGT